MLAPKIKDLLLVVLGELEKGARSYHYQKGLERCVCYLIMYNYYYQLFQTNVSKGIKYLLIK